MRAFYSIIVLLFVLNNGYGQNVWSVPVSIVESHGRLAVGNHLHIVGHIGEKLVHRVSFDNGATWREPVIIGDASQNYPMQYGGLYADGDTVYLLTADGNMGGKEQHAKFRKSTDNGLTWSDPIQITNDETMLRRARIVAYKNFIHVAGLGSPNRGFMVYFRSTDGGATWYNGRILADNLGKYGGGQTISVYKNTLHIPFTKARAGVGAGDTYYIRSLDNGVTWSDPKIVGEQSYESTRQARVQVMASKNKVLLFWQREADSTGMQLLPDRLGYNISLDNGNTWSGATILPDDRGVNREHQQIWLEPDGKIHLCWYTGENFVGYKYSPDFGTTWLPSEKAIKSEKITVPYSIVAKDGWVHILSGPMGEFLYTRKKVPSHNKQ